MHGEHFCYARAYHPRCVGQKNIKTVVVTTTVPYPMRNNTRFVCSDFGAKLLIFCGKSKSIYENLSVETERTFVRPTGRRKSLESYASVLMSKENCTSVLLSKKTCSSVKRYLLSVKRLAPTHLMEGGGVAMYVVGRGYSLTMAKGSSLT